MNCQRCGAQNDDQAAFCDKCGADLQKDRPAPTMDVAASPEAVRYAGFWRRLGAAFIDGLIIYAVQTVIQVVLVAVGVIDLDALQAEPGSADYAELMRLSYVLGGVMFVILIVYSAIMESSSRRATLGKMVLGIVVTDADGKRISLGRAFGRNLAKVISTITLLIGFFMIAFTKKEQGLHDIIAKCLVMEKE